MTLEAATEHLRSRAPEFAPLDARVKFVLEGSGVILIDATRTPPSITNEDGAADCTIRMAEGKFEDLVAGRLSPTLAYTLGQIKVEGSLGVAMRLAGLLES